MKTYWQNYIDGSWVDGGAGRVDVINPSTGEKLAEHALADASDVDRGFTYLARFVTSDRSSAAAWFRRWGATCWITSMTLHPS